MGWILSSVGFPEIWVFPMTCGGMTHENNHPFKQLQWASGWAGWSGCLSSQGAPKIKETKWGQYTRHMALARVRTEDSMCAMSYVSMPQQPCYKTFLVFLFIQQKSITSFIKCIHFKLVVALVGQQAAHQSQTLNSTAHSPLEISENYPGYCISFCYCANARAIPPSSQNT